MKKQEILDKMISSKINKDSHLQQKKRSVLLDKQKKETETANALIERQNDRLKQKEEFLKLKRQG